MIGKRCAAKKKNGEPCTAYALTGDEYCYAHSPARGAERAAARKLGGLNRRTRHNGEACNLPDQVRSLPDVLTILDYVLAETVALENGINRARALIALADSYIRALEVGEFEQRLERLEKVQNES